MSDRDEVQSLQQAFALHRGGKFAEAAKLYRKIIKRNPRQPHALHSLGIIETADGNHVEASRLMARSLAVQPSNVPFMQNYATVLCQLGQYDTAATVSLKGAELDPANNYLLYVAAISLFKTGRSQEALAKFDQLIAREPNNIAALNERGSVLLALGQHDAALAGIEKAISLDPQYAQAHLNMGMLNARLKRHDEAVASFDRALRLNPNLAGAWLGYGGAMSDLRRFDEALAAYDRAEAAKADPADIWLGRGNVFYLQQRHQDAIAAYDRALNLQPTLAEAFVGRGNVLLDLARAEDALASYERGLSLKSDSASAWLGRGHAFVRLKRFPDALEAYDKAIRLDAALPALQGHRLFCRMCFCDWDEVEAESADLLRSIRSGHESAEPFALLGIPSSFDDQAGYARTWAQRYPVRSLPLWRGESYGHDKIRIGYVSADFRQHPVTYLATAVFEQHDRAKFEVTGISIGPRDNSEVRHRLENSFDRFIDGATLDVDQIAKQIRHHEIDILIDLNGFTQNGRPAIFALRPAPLQVNYLGYPGTMGASYMDYIVADPTLIPATQQAGYAEKVAYLPHSYLPHDEAARRISERHFERAEFGLPEDGSVFCCFNNAFKLNRDQFRLRMKVLKAVDGSVLWLTRDNEAAVQNLRKEAVAAGVDPDRLVFANRVPSPADHLARHRLADIFLDTSPYNAHTTASDALWAGLPVLTQIGETFAGRVAAGLLTAIGMPELIAHTPEQFEQMAIDFARDPARLAAIRQKLAENRLSSPLFNTGLYVGHLESAYIAMYQRLRQGLAPDHIHVAP